MRKYRFYKFSRPIIKFLMKTLFRIKVIGKENIPNDKVVLAGNHTNILDAWLLISGTERTLRFLAKKELHKGPFAFIFKLMATIPVNRGGDTTKAKEMAYEALNNNEAIVIFPEGTINKTKKTIMSFKKGAVTFASKTNSPIVPFTIKGKYKLFRKSVVLEFYKPYHTKSDIIEEENNKLMNIITKELEKTNE